WNERGELTEASSSNIVLTLDGKLLTPPVSSGLLPGTMRACLLANGRIHERILTLDDLQHCDDIYLINSVRKWKTAVLV
ncbi:MAG: aminotransferase class IV, partial [Anaerolineales bacterium]|nr:aminotransferase class IV [Anaerolineales bacterium]